MAQVPLQPVESTAVPKGDLGEGMPKRMEHPLLSGRSRQGIPNAFSISGVPTTPLSRAWGKGDGQS
jgi:hypothetical protein